MAKSFELRPRSKHSTARDPFSAFREYALSLTIDETVLDDTLDELTVAVAVAVARLFNLVGGLAHALHTACHHHIGSTQQNVLCGHHNGLHAAGAHLIDRSTSHFVG